MQKEKQGAGGAGSTGSDLTVPVLPCGLPEVFRAEVSKGAVLICDDAAFAARLPGDVVRWFPGVDVMIRKSQNTYFLKTRKIFL